MIDEKTYLVKALAQGGLLVINSDDPKVLELKNKSKEKVVTFGFGPEATVRASHDSIAYKEEEGQAVPSGISFHLDYSGHSIPVELTQSISVNHIYAALAALSIASEKGCNMLEAVSAVKEYRTPPGRLSLIRGINKSIIIDDTYNASPAASEAALELLGKLQGFKRKIAVLGDMLELGRMTVDAHKQIGISAATVANVIITVGKRAQMIAEGAREAGFTPHNTHELADTQRASQVLAEMIKSGDLVLIKGSQGMRMERVVLAVMANPEEHEELLARQEKEWLKRL